LTICAKINGISRNAKSRDSSHGSLANLADRLLPAARFTTKTDIELINIMSNPHDLTMLLSDPPQWRCLACGKVWQIPPTPSDQCIEKRVGPEAKADDVSNPTSAICAEISNDRESGAESKRIFLDEMPPEANLLGVPVASTENVSCGPECDVSLTLFNKEQMAELVTRSKARTSHIAQQAARPETPPK
jgi:hypothetical protein